MGIELGDNYPLDPRVNNQLGTGRLFAVVVAGFQGYIEGRSGSLPRGKLAEGIPLRMGTAIGLGMARRQHVTVFDHHGPDLGVPPGCHSGLLGRRDC